MIHLYDREKAFHTLIRFSTRNTAEFQSIADILGHRLMRPNGVALENHAHVAALRRNNATAARNNLSIHHDFTAVRLDETRHEPQRRCLAATRWAQKRNQFPVFDVQIYLIHRANIRAKDFQKPS